MADIRLDRFEPDVVFSQRRGRGPGCRQVDDQFRANELQNGGGIGQSLLDIGDLWIVRGPGVPVHYCVRCQARRRGGKPSKAVVDELALCNKYSNIVGPGERLLTGNQECFHHFLSSLRGVIGRSAQECGR